MFAPQQQQQSSGVSNDPLGVVGASGSSGATPIPSGAGAGAGGNNSSMLMGGAQSSSGGGQQQGGPPTPANRDQICQWIVDLTNAKLREVALFELRYT